MYIVLAFFGGIFVTGIPVAIVHFGNFSCFMCKASKKKGKHFMEMSFFSMNLLN